MILYLDASSLVKLYLEERGSEDVAAIMQEAETVGTGIVTRAEVAAALAKAVRMGMLAADDGSGVLQDFRGDWVTLMRIPVSESVVSHADALTWEHGLRGHDAVHLASALAWSEAMREQATLSTFDRQLWLAAQRAGLKVHPAELPALP